MIAYLQGTLALAGPAQLIVEAGGVGYEVHIPLTVYEKLAHRIGEEVKIYVHHYLRENTEKLFGFLDTNSKSLFESMLKISGIGPLVALSIQSQMDVADVLEAVRGNNISVFKKVNGVGPAKAKKIIFEMEGRLKKIEKLLGKPASTMTIEGGSSIKTDAVVALHENLGFDLDKSARVVEKLLQGRPDLVLEEVIRRALLEMY